MVNEIWKDVIGYEEFYQVSNLGNIRSKELKRVKTITINKNGYAVCSLKSKQSYVHRIVVEAFINKIPKGLTVNHIDGDKANNKVENLEILSYSDNHKHAFNVLKRKPSSLGKFGKDHTSSKPIIQYSIDGNPINEFENARDAERKLGVSYKGISSCCHGNINYHAGYIWKFKEDITHLNLQFIVDHIWSENDDDIIRNYYSQMTRKQLAEKIGTTAYSIKMRLKKLGIKKRLN